MWTPTSTARLLGGISGVNLLPGARTMCWPMNQEMRWRKGTKKTYGKASTPEKDSEDGTELSRTGKKKGGGHTAGTYDAGSDTGGSNGAGMRYEAEGGDPANAGLQNARAFLEPVKARHPWIT
ncbi:hypothetical protein MAPG_08499 [Magnaporthiopsis poae ATCC 64411]|uniref:Uncharacterized protein n=1 Tax=Magnaporthiopsis poae (strain ATCC 64411 / 73-15) TaxID=644358 RepID=A0A0C4E7I6_MAGP6|nr:hypothetical protein MAPG_08499 [Magnaporthiopsis poae ATCC 64411]